VHEGRRQDSWWPAMMLYARHSLLGDRTRVAIRGKN
jgi:hypothetical protein